MAKKKEDLNEEFSLDTTLASVNVRKRSIGQGIQPACDVENKRIADLTQGSVTRQYQTAHGMQPTDLLECFRLLFIYLFWAYAGHEKRGTWQTYLRTKK